MSSTSRTASWVLAICSSPPFPIIVLWEASRSRSPAELMYGTPARSITTHVASPNLRPASSSGAVTVSTRPLTAMVIRVPSVGVLISIVFSHCKYVVAVAPPVGDGRHVFLTIKIPSPPTSRSAYEFAPVAARR